MLTFLEWKVSHVPLGEDGEPLEQEAPETVTEPAADTAPDVQPAADAQPDAAADGAQP